VIRKKKDDEKEREIPYNKQPGLEQKPKKIIFFNLMLLITILTL
jgi:hypothetical protein